MTERVKSFYDSLATSYHLIFEDWDCYVERQASLLDSLLATRFSRHPLTILDCASGIGSQALGLAALGHRVIGSDLSPAAIDRARQEAQARSLDIPFIVSDMTSLREVEADGFDAVLAIDNALPHLKPAQLDQAAAAIASKLGRNGVFLASIRDYEQMIVDRPRMQQPGFMGAPGNRRIVHQVWDWVDDRTYTVHMFITIESGSEWEARHFVSEYRCLLRGELTAILEKAGFADISWLMPNQTGYLLPLVLAQLQS